MSIDIRSAEEVAREIADHYGETYHDHAAALLTAWAAEVATSALLSAAETLGELAFTAPTRHRQVGWCAASEAVAGLAIAKGGAWTSTTKTSP